MNESTLSDLLPRDMPDGRGLIEEGRRIGDDVTVGQGSDLVADDDVVINQNVTVTNNLVVKADDDNNDNGVITATGSLSSTGLGLSAAGNIDDGAGGALQVDVATFGVDGGVWRKFTPLPFKLLDFAHGNH
mgnify:CR=1 FL=1